MDKEIFLEDFNRISKIGWTKEFGVNREALNEFDIKARNALIGELKKIGSSISFDDAGNIYGSLNENETNAIIIGSHMDSVPNGGRFDGMYGVIAGLNVLKNFHINGIRKNLMLVDFTNEEGSRWQPDLQGSGIATGVFDKEFIYSRIDRENKKFVDVLKASGFQGKEENRIKNLNPEHFIELHIEQGPVLEKEGYSIGIPYGIVTDIVDFYTFIGESNQAGPTPMNLRKDALVGASRFISEINEIAKKQTPNIVMTVGEINNIPNIYSVIPSIVKLKLDIRSPDQHLAYENASIVYEKAKCIAEDLGLTINKERGWALNTTLFDEDLIKKIEKACKELDLKYKHIYSWATHDAMYMNKITSTAMIMIPSHNGRSHTKEEFSSDEDMIAGLKVLKKVIDLI